MRRAAVAESHFGPKSTMLLLGVLGLVSMVMRYPGDHELGVDSFTIHALAQSIFASGYAKWTVSPLSYFGWYPLSYPSGDPFFLASLSATSGVSVEVSILISSMFLGLLGILGAFMLARELRTESGFALLVALLYGLAPRFLDFTLWTASARNLFMAILPIFVWSLIRLNKKVRITELAIAVIILICLAAAHRLVILALVIVGAFFVAYIIHTVYGLLKLRYPAVVMKSARIQVTRWAGLAAAIAVGGGLLAGSNLLHEYSTGELASGSSLVVEVFNLIVSITRSVGFALPLAAIGLLYVTQGRSPSIRETFVVVSLVGFIPTLLLRQYTGFYILPFLAIVGGYGFVGLLHSLRRRPRLATTVAVVLLLGLGSLSSSILAYETSANPPASSETYSLSLYVARLAPSGVIIGNDALTASRVTAYTNRGVLPPSGSTVGSPGPEVLALGYYSWDEVNLGLTRISLDNITADSDSLWVVNGVNPVGDYATFMSSSFNAIPTALVDRYHPTYYMAVKGEQAVYVGLGGVVYPSKLGASLDAGAYVVFDDGANELWWMG